MPREADCGNFGSCRAAQISAKAMSASKNWTITMFELPGVIEDGMPGRNGQRKPGTTRGSPRRSRTTRDYAAEVAVYDAIKLIASSGDRPTCRNVPGSASNILVQNSEDNINEVEASRRISDAVVVLVECGSLIASITHVRQTWRILPEEKMERIERQNRTMPSAGKTIFIGHGQSRIWL